MNAHQLVQVIVLPPLTLMRKYEPDGDEATSLEPDTSPLLVLDDVDLRSMWTFGVLSHLLAARESGLIFSRCRPVRLTVG